MLTYLYLYLHNEYGQHGLRSIKTMWAEPGGSSDFSEVVVMFASGLFVRRTFHHAAIVADLRQWVPTEV